MDLPGPDEWKTFTHPEYGDVRVLFGWKLMQVEQLPGAAVQFWAWVPRAVEFDLFTPEHEQAVLMESFRATSVER